MNDDASLNQSKRMTRKHDLQLQRDSGKTQEELLTAGHNQDSEGQMRNDRSVRHHCPGCDRWFEEVFAVSIDTSLCWACRKKLATGR